MNSQIKTNPSIATSNIEVSALLGVAIGDAVALSQAAKASSEILNNSIQQVNFNDSSNQPEGTWSNDSSLTFCLAESLISGYDLKEISSKFVKWMDEGFWTARGSVFNIGTTTAVSLSRLKQIILREDWIELKQQKFYGNERDNGNGSLMRILPLVFYIKDLPIEEQFNVIWEVSALTHRHIRAAMSCLIYLKFAEYLIRGEEKSMAYETMQFDILTFWDALHFPQNERRHFNRLIQNDVRLMKKEELISNGYVVSVLESSIWFLLNNENFEDTILSNVNIGENMGRSAAISGGLAGIYYGVKHIPESWISSVARFEDIIDLGNKLHKAYN